VQYTEFLIETLKPYIDQNYRTLTGRENTGIIGSSMGGFISHYGSLKFQEVFGKSGNFSPAYFYSDSVWMFTNEMGKQRSMKIYQMAGDQESSTMVSNMLAMHDTLINLGFDETEVLTKVVEGGEHNELFWQQEFAEAYLWLFASYANDIYNIGSAKVVNIYPNPVISELTVSEDKIGRIDTMRIINLTGQVIMEIVKPQSNVINVKKLKPGTYVIKIYAGNEILMAKFIKQDP